MKSVLARSILALGLAAGMASTSLAQGVSDTEILIGSNGHLSGVFAPFNVQAIKAAQQYFDEVNAAGGVHGRKIEVVEIENDNNEPTKGAEITQRLVEQE